MTSLEMRNLIFEALAEKNPEKTPWKKTFEMYGYRGTVSALRALVEYIGIEHGVIEKVVEIPTMAWGVPGEYPYYLSNTNLDNDNLDLFNEEVHLMTYHNILSPGAIGGYGDSLPYFHVTKYGLKCIEERDIFPYDPDAYMQKISSISSIDEWEKFYIEQSLKCYNADAFESALIMLGLAGEYLATQLIEKMESFLANKEPTLQATYVNALQGKNVVSQRYAEYENITDFEAIFERVKNQCDLFWLENLNLRGGFKKTIMDYIAGKYPDLVPLYDEIYNKHNRSYFEALEVKAEEMAKKYDCPFVDNEMPYGRVPQGHPVIVDYFYHEEIRGTENTGKRNR